MANTESLLFARKFRWKISVKWYWNFFGTENSWNGIKLYHLQNTSKVFAFSGHKA